MVVSPDPFLDECFIKKPIKKEMKETQDNVDFEKPLQTEKTLSFEKPLPKDVNAFIKETAAQITENLANTTGNLKTNPPVEEFDEPISIEVEELDAKQPEEDKDVLKEIDLATTLDNNLESITLKKPNQVYYEIYQKAREKAKEAKKIAVAAYLELKQIKKTYMLDDIDESDDSEVDNLDSDSDNDSEEYLSDAEDLQN
jgi:hypothetical protein